MNVSLAAANVDTAGPLAVALGIGLLMGLERERRKGSGPGREFAGVRTFALVALLGGIAVATGIETLVPVAAAFVAAVAVLGYALGARDDPGLTSEVALIVAFLLGALAQACSRSWPWPGRARWHSDRGLPQPVAAPGSNRSGPYRRRPLEVHVTR